MEEGFRGGSRPQAYVISWIWYWNSMPNILVISSRKWVIARDGIAPNNPDRLGPNIREIVSGD